MSDHKLSVHSKNNRRTKSQARLHLHRLMDDTPSNFRLDPLPVANLGILSTPKRTSSDIFSPSTSSDKLSPLRNRTVRLSLPARKRSSQISSFTRSTQLSSSSSPDGLSSASPLRDQYELRPHERRLARRLQRVKEKAKVQEAIPAMAKIKALTQKVQRERIAYFAAVDAFALEEEIVVW
ncbi:uncharacterized protein L969DRAFT_94330 [Mixia osmundae IAM 14324]|uniref:Uncharacterized protein n=1 Tax=Mixia osmundae (strain CBS 9802 / IAM 14324 / JCM 22182 / KY 12970) TaxID=764103 RepID=G7DZS6_MIXOS|nr:uncharacterized protein L969DRAFT_94330 [Mixia osmundae IAM 14324]KEI39255.1 hypothetical protein L969DRAFT_94330 [Mixia osmundae IAM 14324]GAA96086.1 hypothetical protein E5Q_02747 [Mixia osmundae IAM 14324]